MTVFKCGKIVTTIYTIIRIENRSRLINQICGHVLHGILVLHKISPLLHNSKNYLTQLDKYSPNSLLTNIPLTERVSPRNDYQFRLYKILFYFTCPVILIICLHVSFNIIFRQVAQMIDQICKIY